MDPKKAVKWASVETSALNKKILIDGNQIYWEKFGQGPQVVLCIAGVLGDVKSCFHPVWEKMDVEFFTFIGMDLPGYGYSRPPDRDYSDPDTYNNDAKVAMELMKELGYTKFSLLTHSGGGIVATILASSFPEAVDKVIYCNAPFHVDEKFFMGARAISDLDKWDSIQRSYLLHRYGGKDYPTKVLKSWVGLVERLFRSNEHLENLKEKLGNMRAEALFITGLRDRIIPENTALEMQKCNPRLRIQKVRKGLHSHLSFLDEFVEVSQDFLTED
ncbi:unnamed protein product [Allacma fusca]|uniref:AB hydrolase-1 domain-containing protein n=1 Tax=Allacma fusca TaxID=39272 RepID=A0A8J2P3I5_9HEXA|nr:unnamed protein product [Allacma fusca]